MRLARMRPCVHGAEFPGGGGSRKGAVVRCYVEILLIKAVVDFPGTNGMRAILPPAFSTVRRSC